MAVIDFLRARDQAVVNSLAVIAFVVAALFRVPLADHKGWSTDARRIVSLAADLGIGYLAAWFFYYLVSWRPAYQTRHRVSFMVVTASLTRDPQAAARYLACCVAPPAIKDRAFRSRTSNWNRFASAFA